MMNLKGFFLNLNKVNTQGFLVDYWMNMDKLNRLVICLLLALPFCIDSVKRRGKLMSTKKSDNSFQ